MMENKEKLLLAAVVVLIALFGLVALSNLLPSYEFKAEAQGIEFYSNLGQPIEYLHSLKDNPSFIITTHMTEEPSEINSIMSQGLNLFTVLLVANGKQPITLVKAFDSSDSWSGCQTNHGNIKVIEDISLSECQRLLTNLDRNVLVEINFPNSMLQKPRVILEPNQIKVFPKNAADIPQISFTILNALYPGSAASIQAFNDAAGEAMENLNQ